MKKYILTSDSFRLLYCGILGTVSSIALLFFSWGFGFWIFGLTAYMVLMVLSIMCYIAAYAIQTAEQRQNIILLTGKDPARVQWHNRHTIAAAHKLWYELEREGFFHDQKYRV